MFKFIIQRNKGFTLVETLVAISIFTVSLVGMMGVLARGIANTTYSQKAQTATYLAQEGIEYMRNMRDSYMLYSSNTQSGWDAFNGKLTAAQCQNSNGCYFNADNVFTYSQPMPMTQITVAACSLSDCGDHPLLYYSATGSYGYAGVTSGYIRQIKINQVGSPVNETQITSTVYWTQGSGTYKVTLSENLFNWIE